MNTRIFLDGGDPVETKKVMELVGYLDGQTTNPTLISKNPEAAKRLKKGEKFTKKEILDFYKKIVTEISDLILDGSVSVEVYADKNTTSKQMLTQGKEMFEWIPNAHIKYPTTKSGLQAAEESIKLGMRVNMTLVFTQSQAAAVYSATMGAKKGQVFVSPFIGRIDDQGKNGMDLIKNIIKMYQKGDGHVEILSASIRNNSHFMESLRLGSDIITCPFKVLKEWSEKDKPRPNRYFQYPKGDLEDIPYELLDLNQDWREFDIENPLTENGIAKFANDWNSLIKDLDIRL